MQSPFTIFRKHQRAAMVALTLMAMFAFVFLDTFQRSANRSGAQGATIAVETKAGDLTDRDLNALRQRRELANRFVETAFLESHPDFKARMNLFQSNPQFRQFLGPQIAQMEQEVESLKFGFGREPRMDVLFTYLLRSEAHRLRVVVDDTQIESYIDQLTERKLSSEQFYDIVKRLHTDPKQLYDILRDELQARLAFYVVRPANPQSPEQLWKFYQRLNIREKLEVAKIPVTAFVHQVPNPSDAEVAVLFEPHKSHFDEVEDGALKPGFKQPHKAELQYLRTSFEETEARVLKTNPVTSEEIKAHYEKNKDTQYKISTIPAEPVPETTDEEGNKRPSPPLLPDEIAPEEAKPQAETPAPEKKNDDAPKPEEKPKGAPAEGDKKDEAKKPDNPCADPAEDKVEKKSEDKAAKPVPAGADKYDATKPAKKSAEESKPEGAAKPQAEKPAATDAEVKKVEKPALPPRYKPLTDELRDQIREELERERTLQEMKSQSEKAATALRNIGLRLTQAFPNASSKPAVARELAAKAELQKVAAEHLLKFGETDLVSAAELHDVPGIGRAQEPSENEFAPTGSSLLQLVYTQSGLLNVHQVEDPLTKDRFVVWKVQDVPAHVPQLGDPGVKEQVVKAWKMQKAEVKAKQRAEELVKQIKESKKPLAEALAATTVTGDKEGQQFTVQETPEFSWLRESPAPPGNPFGARPPPTISDPIFVDKPGEQFMATVFDELKLHEVGVAANADRSAFYVVKVLERKPGVESARADFLKTPLFGREIATGLFHPTSYDQLSFREQQMANYHFVQHLERQYAVKWHERDEDAASSGMEE